jgi:hypothetical protein
MKITAPGAEVPHPNTNNFGVHTRIARAVGKDSRYSSDAIRALPSPNKDEVVLQATDGHQATCLLVPGQMTEARLVPNQVLPARHLPKPAAVHLIDGHWQSSEGKIAQDSYGVGEGAFPPISQVLPAVYKRPFYETAAQAQKRHQSNGVADSVHVVVGIDIDHLLHVTEAFGTRKLTLFVPVPVKGPNQTPAETFVNKPIPICPATAEGQCRGIAVLMPIRPTCTGELYTKVRDAVIAAEQKADKSTRKTDPPKTPRSTGDRPWKIKPMPASSS